MARKETVSAQVDSDLKLAAEAIIKSVGLTPSKAISQFYEQIKLHNGIPFNNISAQPTKATSVEIKPKMPVTWQNWTRENIERGCNLLEIKEILLKNNFSLDLIKEVMGNVYPEDVVDMPVSEIDYEALSKVNITRIGKRIETDLLQLYTLENFMTEKECAELVDIINTRLRPSTITMDKNDKYYRTSTTCDLSHIKNPFVEEIDRRIAKSLGINLAYSEGIQAQRYDIGQEFKQHTDYFEPRTEEYKRYASVQGNRTWTFMVYLNNTIQGGGTYFVNLDKTFYPKKGMAVVWNNLYPDGLPNPDTLHWGLPVEQGVKVIITKWFRERGTGKMFA